MRRAPILFLLLSLVGFAVLPEALRAAEGHDGAAAAAADPAYASLEPDEGPPPAETEATAQDVASPWEHPLWHNATTMMRVYICDYARRRPTWCGEAQELPAKTALPEPQGPPLIAEDAEWLAFLDGAEPASFTAEDVARVRQRATVRRDPQAMEILGYLYAEGIAVERDYAEAYRWYGLAFLAGEKRVRPNMDIVWQQLQRLDVEAALRLTREFDALAQGEVPPGFEAPPAAPPQ